MNYTKQILWDKQPIWCKWKYYICRRNVEENKVTRCYYPKDMFKHVAHFIVSSSLSTLTFEVHFFPASIEACLIWFFSEIPLSEREK